MTSFWLMLCLVVIPLGRFSSAQERSSASQATQVFRVAPETGLPRGASHPLQKAIGIARDHERYIQRSIRDYKCVLVSRERIDGKLRQSSHVLVKCRRERLEDGEVVTPFSLYMKYLSPSSLVGREVLHVSGRDRGDILVRKGGRRNAFLNWWVDPNSDLALRDNRYPITEFGFSKLTRRLIEVAEADLRYDECDVKYLKGGKVDGRSCFVIEVLHPIERPYFRFHLARVFIDDELHVPIHYSAYSWPTVPGGPPVLEEQYTYQHVKLNVGLTDYDFDRKNPQYGFRKD